jgi:D-alanyl-D-alanine dipeptidase
MRFPRENRVKVSDYGVVATDDRRLVPVASVGGKSERLHATAAAAFKSLRAAASRAGHDLRIASGWRAHKWRSRAHYERAMIEQYGSVGKGQRYRAYNSPHETGLAFDLGSGGLRPHSASIARQRRTALYQWLVENAAGHGVTPYNNEPWHWEVNVSRMTWRTGGTMGPAAPLLIASALIATVVWRDDIRRVFKGWKR